MTILEALGDTDDTEKMKRANECVIELLQERKSLKSNSLKSSLPVEWLCPKNGLHINSLDSLLSHEDLVKDYLQGKNPLNQNRAGKETIEKELFEKDITKWEGVISEISSDLKGTISFKKHIRVSFAPVNVQPSMPNEGDEVRFCLAFHWTGPCAWSVVCQAVTRSAISFPREDDTDGGASDKDEEESLLPLVSEPIHPQEVRAEKDSTGDEGENANRWSKCLDSEK